MKLTVVNSNGDNVGEVTVSDTVFDAAMNRSLVHQAMVIYQGNKRQGTHSTKTRAQVSGGGRKPWIQKHTGRARQGSIRSPQWRHGGIAFGPHPRSYRKSIPTRMRRQAVRCVLSEKVRSGSLICIDNFDIVDGKTKSMVQILNNLGITGSALVITPEPNKDLIQAAHNIDKIWTLPINQLNANDLLRRQTVLITQSAAEQAAIIWDAVPTRGGRRLENGQNPVDLASETVEQTGEEETPRPRRRRTTTKPTEAE